MGDPKFRRRKYESPQHPWETERFKEELELLKKYGLKNKRELWKAKSKLRMFRQRARILQAQIRYGEEQAEKEKKELIARLARYGFLKENATLDDVLALNVDVILGRRLQTMAVMKRLAYSPRQARQFIVHGHIAIGSRRVTVPGYLVKRTEEDMLEYDPSSPLRNEAHPSRPPAETEVPPIPSTEEPEEEDEGKEKS